VSHGAIYFHCPRCGAELQQRHQDGMVFFEIHDEH
jgi:hypothetical protein